MRSLGVSDHAPLTADELARRYGVMPRALHLYERVGLLMPARHEGALVYGQRECVRLEVILRAEQLDIPLSVLKDLIDGMEGGL